MWYLSEIIYILTVVMVLGLCTFVKTYLTVAHL